MVTVTVLAILLTFNMILMHGHKFVEFYYYCYRKLNNPKFRPGEFVMIDDREFEIILITHNSKPYTYFCLPTSNSNARMLETYFHESRIKKKTGLLKELE